MVKATNISSCCAINKMWKISVHSECFNVKLKVYRLVSVYCSVITKRIQKVDLSVKPTSHFLIWSSVIIFFK